MTETMETKPQEIGVFLITWKEFEKRKMIDKQEIVVNKANSLALVQTFNAEQRKTTTDYRSYNLTKILGDKAFTIIKNT